MHLKNNRGKKSVVNKIVQNSTVVVKSHCVQILYKLLFFRLQMTGEIFKCRCEKTRSTFDNGRMKLLRAVCTERDPFLAFSSLQSLGFTGCIVSFSSARCECVIWRFNVISLMSRYFLSEANLPVTESSRWNVFTHSWNFFKGHFHRKHVLV